MREWKILLVDDQEYSRELLRNMILAVAQQPQLQPRRYSFIEANSAQQAAFMFNMHNPDLVFLDIDLPDGSGLELLHNLKIQRQDSFFVMVSGISTLENVKQAISEGAASFIVKPFNGDKIIAVMQLFDKYRDKKLQAGKT